MNNALHIVLSIFNITVTEAVNLKYFFIVTFGCFRFGLWGAIDDGEFVWIDVVD